MPLLPPWAQLCEFSTAIGELLYRKGAEVAVEDGCYRDAPEYEVRVEKTMPASKICAFGSKAPFGKKAAHARRPGFPIVIRSSECSTKEELATLQVSGGIDCSFPSELTPSRQGCRSSLVAFLGSLS